MSELAESVLPLIRTRAQVWEWNVANRHGEEMHHGVDILERELERGDPHEVYVVTTKAIASAMKVIARADDSSGIIGDACRRLLDLHPHAAFYAQVPPHKVVTWMMAFQFDGDVDFFEIDPVAYAPVLGEAGVKRYRAKLEAVRQSLPEQPPGPFGSPASHEHSVLEWNDRRLAVLDRDVDAIIRTHARDQTSPHRLVEAAQAFEEIGDVDRALTWALKAAHAGSNFQAQRAAEYWCELLSVHRPDELVDARLEVFRRWPSAAAGARLREALGEQWPAHRAAVLDALAGEPREVVMFALSSLKEPALAWRYATELDLRDDRLWMDLVKAYEVIDPEAALPVHRALAEADIERKQAQSYRLAARRMARMRTLAAGTPRLEEIEAWIAHVRETYRRRPRLQSEMDGAGLP